MCVWLRLLCYVYTARRTRRESRAIKNYISYGRPRVTPTRGSGSGCSAISFWLVAVTSNTIYFLTLSVVFVRVFQWLIIILLFILFFFCLPILFGFLSEKKNYQNESQISGTSRTANTHGSTVILWKKNVCLFQKRVIQYVQVFCKYDPSFSVFGCFKRLSFIKYILYEFV